MDWLLVSLLLVGIIVDNVVGWLAAQSLSALHAVTRWIYSQFQTEIPVIRDSRKQSIAILATGGTIAGVSDSQNSPYLAGVTKIEDLVRVLPGIESAYDIVTTQICNKASSDITDEDLVLLHNNIQKTLLGVDGVVITCGTDTIEEVACLIQFTIITDKPVVFTGSIRPPTSLSADGPKNLLSAIQVAGCRASRYRGVLMVMNDRIYCPEYTTKMNSNVLDAFSAPDAGLLGQIINGNPVFYFQPARSPLSMHFNMTKLPKLSTVHIIYGHQGADSSQFQYLAPKGVEGVVLACMGSGSWPENAREYINRLAHSAIVVASSRTAATFVSSEFTYGLGSHVIGSGFLNPEKTRMVLRVCLAIGKSSAEVSQILEN